ncbi:MAG TPA: sulfotransferase domain-containing protein [Chloroflexota bacterium]
MTFEDSSSARFVAIVSGLPRSGTSMMMQMLEAGGIPPLTDAIRQADEDNPRGYYEFEAVKDPGDYSTWIERAEGKAVKMVYRLLYRLPDTHRYRIVFMTRPLQEVIASQGVMLERHGKESTTVEDVRLADLYGKQLSEVKVWLAARPHISVFYVDYHDALHDSARVAEELNTFFGGALDVDAMRRVPDAALYRQRKPAENAESRSG